MGAIFVSQRVVFMNSLNPVAPSHALGKFEHPDITARGERRASVDFTGMQTLWFNTGTLCNIECINCYIESSPSNDRLVYLTTADVTGYLDEIDQLGWKVDEIAFTGGEPFLNPDMIEIADNCLARGYRVLILTNAMKPMMRQRVRPALLALREKYGDVLTLRVSLDHYTAALHDKERGEGVFDKAMKGMRWLAEHKFSIDVAGRTCWGEEESKAREGYARLFADEGISVDADDPAKLVLFPEMDEKAEVPEITTDCWNILDVNPAHVMCASSRMVVKRRGAEKPAVLACTLLPYDAEFELGSSLAEAAQPIKLNHPHCAKFCVLGGGSCAVHD